MYDVRTLVQLEDSGFAAMVAQMKEVLEEEARLLNKENEKAALARLAHDSMEGMTPWKMPPRSKVYEALGAVADSRVALTGDHTAEVTSSAGNKKYQIEWSADLKTFSSNDNASFYVGYAGYPIIAVLLNLGVIAYKPSVAQKLANIKWKELNTKHKNDFDRAVEEALSSLSPDERSELESEISRIYAELEGLQLEKGVRRVPPKEAAA